jgi:hypothetical protein
MQLSTTRIVSCNMTSFLVLNHEKVRYRNEPLKPYNNNWWDHLANDNINHLRGASTLCLQKLDDSLAKEPISTHAKCATWTLAQKADFQSIVKHNCKHLSANHQRSYWLQLLHLIWVAFWWHLRWLENKPVSFQWNVWTTHHGQAFPVSKIHKISLPKRLRGCVYWGHWSNNKRLPERCLHL